MGLTLQATRATLALRAALLADIRAFFAARGVLEVETPALSAAAAPDLQLESVVARAESLGPRAHYLHTSPEYAMKRLLAAGSGDIYQICRVFRDGEIGRWHQPEFTLLEWYRSGWSDSELMAEVEALLVRVLRGRCPLGTSVRLSYRRAFVDHLGLDPDAERGALAEALARHGVEPPAQLECDGLLELALGTVVAPRLEPHALTFITEYPASQAALARIRPGSPPVAARFEVFAGGLELGNGFEELTDAEEQRQRFHAQIAERRRLGRALRPIDEEFLAALAHGLAPCAGVAIGIDRVIALAAGLSSVAQAMSFAHERASFLDP